MENTYLPHLGGGSINTDPNGTSSIAFNWGITTPISSDPRTIISIWGDKDPNAYGALSSTELFAGLLVYCLDDKKLRVCRWIPNYQYFNIEDCVWDVLHNDGSVEWQSVVDFEHEDTIDERIEKILAHAWRFRLVSTNTYWTIYSGSELDDILNNLVLYIDDNDYISGSLSAASTRKGKSATLKFSSFTDAAYTHAASGNIIVAIPSTKKVDSIKINGEIIELNVISKEIKAFNTNTKLYDTCEYSFYTSTKSFSIDELKALTDNSVVITFTA